MKKLTTEQRSRMEQGAGAIIFAGLFATCMVLFILTIPNWDQSVTDAWNWIINFKGVW